MHTLAVKLGSDILSVVGTVNGETVEWTYLQGYVWQAVVPRADTGVYAIEVVGYDAAGNTSTYRATLKYGLAAITNRGPGTYYNATDLNRVEGSVKFLADLLRGYGYGAEIAERTEEWTREDLPNPAEMERYLGNIQALMDVYCTLPTTPPLPDSMRWLGYEGANAIEQILIDLYFLIQNMAVAWFHSGEVFCGEV